MCHEVHLARVDLTSFNFTSVSIWKPVAARLRLPAFRKLPASAKNPILGFAIPSFPVRQLMEMAMDESSTTTELNHLRQILLIFHLSSR